METCPLWYRKKKCRQEQKSADLTEYNGGTGYSVINKTENSRNHDTISWSFLTEKAGFLDGTSGDLYTIVIA